MRRRQLGFTLIEIMIVVVIIGILVAIALPNYQAYTAKSNRAAAQTAMYGLSQAMERYFTLNSTYVGATIAGLNYPPNVPQTSSAPNYVLSLSNLTATTYTITATRQSGSSMASDMCLDMTLTQAGTRGPAGIPAECWGT